VIATAAGGSAILSWTAPYDGGLRPGYLVTPTSMGLHRPPHHVPIRLNAV
jgi:hypothetical protein